ncbi:MAG: hypothetical protein LBF40_04210 [Deltaproteobacteria bacterium]|jgi:flagellin-like hook-associated protein FlgL|nr:hypothetical protein [Deltaproteobacteria bacterium]
MIYRTSQRGTYRQITNNLDLLSWKIAQMSNQIASEKQINKPSDNPSGASTVLRTRTALSQIAQHTENVNYSSTWLTNTGNVLDSLKGLLDEVYTKAEQAATDTYNADQRQVIATEIDLLFQSMVQLGNARQGENHLLSGQKVDVQPFAFDLRAQDVIAACENTTTWTGQVQNAGDREYESRPDMAAQSQDFIIECVRAGGVDSFYYATQSSLALAKITDTEGLYSLKVQATDQSNNQTTVSFVAGPENIDYTGTGGTRVDYAAAAALNTPVTVTYLYGTSAAMTYATHDGNGNISVHLRTNPAGTASLANASEVAWAVNQISSQTGVSANAPVPLSTATVDLATDSNGSQKYTSIGFNNKLSAKVDGNDITVYLERANKSVDAAMGLVSTIDEVGALLNSDPATNAMITATLTSTGQGTVPPWPQAQVTGTRIALAPSDPYTLASTTMEVEGTHNDIVFSVANDPAAPLGAAGNALSVRYDYPEHPTETNPASVRMSGTTLVVTLANSAALFLEEYARLYNDPKSTGYHNAKEAERLARGFSTTSTAADVVALVAAMPASENPYHVTARMADGNSGLGRLTQAEEKSFSGGYDQAALFRVSQDGGKTWGPPMSITASEFQNGLYYNSQLGHASLTTDIPGDANDLVLTANHMGTWGDDVRLEYLAPNVPNSELKVTLGPSPWNIQVTLATDAQGKVVTTANDVMEAINSHPGASQLVTVGLADYHVGGDGIVRAMDCVSLSTGEPYEVNGQTKITPLGHATAAVRFDYTAPTQKSPDLIYQALEHGTDGNYIGIRYTMSADTSVYPNAEYQDHVSISYEDKPNGDKVVVVHLATVSLPSCPDPDNERDAYDAWRALYPVYSCSSSRAVTSTAGDVLEALVAKNIEDPENALVWASMDYKDEGWDSTAKVGATDGTVWLSGGDNELKEEDYGVALRFIPDGSPIGLGDRFEVEVGWYNGDTNDLDVNVSNGYKVTMNVTGDKVLGANGEEENALDTIMRLQWALLHNDVEGVEAELPHLRAAILRVTTEETKVGTSLIRNQYVSSNLDLNKYAAESTLSQIEDADFTTLITNLKNAQLVYEAVLGTTGLTTKLSLLNYI